VIYLCFVILPCFCFIDLLLVYWILLLLLQELQKKEAAKGIVGA
jgi:hypothetical protein